MLGKGSVAHVFLARDNSLKRLVAVKVLQRNLAVDPIGRKRFVREAQAAARISHPCVTSVYTVGALSNDVPYIEMEYIEGTNLAEQWMRLHNDVSAKGNLYVPDYFNNRVLVYHSPFSADKTDGKGDTVPDLVIGQEDYTSNGVNRGMGSRKRDASSLFLSFGGPRFTRRRKPAGHRLFGGKRPGDVLKTGMVTLVA